MIFNTLISTAPILGLSSLLMGFIGMNSMANAALALGCGAAIMNIYLTLRGAK